MPLFKRKPKTEDPPVAKKAKLLPSTKKVQFCYIKPKELEQMLTDDINAVLTLEPVNYYAEKNRYWQCVFFFDEEYAEIIMRFELYENDRKTFGGDYRVISKELYGKILLKFGQRLS